MHKTFGLLLASLFILLACAGNPPRETAITTSTGLGESQAPPGSAQTQLGAVAIGQIALAHPTAKLVYQVDTIKDALATELATTGGYRVVDWDRLDAVLARRNLQWSDVADDAAQRREIQGVLLNDYFLVGSVSTYREDVEFTSSAFSKRKTLVGRVQLDLLLKDATSNEVVASSRASAEGRRELKQNLGFGAAGSNDAALAQTVLNAALAKSVRELAAQTAQWQTERSGSTTATANQTPTEAPANSFTGKRILFIVHEADRMSSAAEAVTLLSTAEFAMAKVFLEHGSEVQTTDDVLTEEALQQRDMRHARQGLGAHAAAVGRAVGADYVVLGLARVDQTSVAMPGENEAPRGIVALTAKLIEPARGRVAAMVEQRRGFTSLQNQSRLLARESAMSGVARLAARELYTTAPERLATSQPAPAAPAAPDTSSPANQSLSVKIQTLGGHPATAIKQALQALAGVRQVMRLVAWDDSAATFVIEAVLPAPAEATVADHLQTDLRGLELLEANNGVIRMSY